jgi:ribosomal protein S18 acetylase RimI-like enzyme
MEVVLACLEHLEDVASLFDQYRVFYNQASDLEAARSFLQARFQNGDSILFVAIDQGQIVGFTQLYPSFSSVLMKRIWILNDLFVVEPYRQQGVAKALINAAANFARETGAVRIALSTQKFNKTAQALYESLGYGKDEEFYHYALRLT